MTAPGPISVTRGAGPPARQHSAARLIDVEAALMLQPRADVRTEHAVLVEELRRDARERRRAVNLEVGDRARSHVPALEHQATGSP